MKEKSKNMYDLIIVDYAFADDEAKKILWGEKKDRKPTRDEAKGRLFTIKDVSELYKKQLTDIRITPSIRNSVFQTNRNVLLRSFASKMAFDMFGPVLPTRLNATQSAFPNAEILVFDPRNELYGGKEFYEYYEYKGNKGREFYRNLVIEFTKKIVEIEIIKYIMKKYNKPIILKSIFNIALFAGFVATLGSLLQYLSNFSINLIRMNNYFGWIIFIFGVLILIIGSLSLSIHFESLTRKIYKWVNQEKNY